MRSLRDRETRLGGKARRRSRCAAIIAAGLCLALSLPRTAHAAVESAAWHLAVTAQPTTLVPGAAGRKGFLVVATNVGAADTTGEITVTDVLPNNLLPAKQEEECKTL